MVHSPESRENQEGAPTMSALNFVRAPLLARRMAKFLMWILLLTPIALALVPWQQSLSANGRVIAKNPTLREQVVQAPVTGRISKIHIREGETVQGPQLDSEGKVIPGKEGTLLVSIRDPDPNRMERLLQQRTNLEERRRAAQDQKTSIQQLIGALSESKQRALAIARQQMMIAKQGEQAAQQALEQSKAAYQLAEYQWKQQRDLLSDQLTSELEYNQAVQKKQAALAEQLKAQASLSQAGLTIQEKLENLGKVEPDFSGQIDRANADLNKVESELAGAEAALTDLNSSIARQGTQEVYAPCDGTVSRVLVSGAGGGNTVSAGTALMRIVPQVEEDELIVEMTVDGQDAPLILELWQEHLRKTGEKPQIPVRLQFEGYPAVQFVGWPSAAVGTFGGLIYFVDQTDDGKGNFRILVRRDPQEEAENPWPRSYALRQGLRVKGWVLLNQVTLGWELWRRLNGFPPVVAGERKDNAKKPSVLKKVK